MAGHRHEPEGTKLRILLIMTGGTICMTRSDDGFVPTKGFLAAGLAPRPSFNDGSAPPPIDAVDESGARTTMQSLRTPLSAYNRRIRYCVLEYSHLLDSSSVDAASWSKVAATIARNYALFDGFVVLHGTDTMAYTCAALSFLLDGLGKPVVVTGSQKPMSELQTDATDNLLGSMIIASHFAIPEVCLFFNHRLFRGNRVTKTAAANFDAFRSPNHPALASVCSAGTTVLWHLVRAPPPQSRGLTVRTGLDTAHIACLRVFPGIKPELVDAVLRIQGLRGLVLETFGAGNAPGGPGSVMLEVLADAVRRGVVVVNITQCLSGNVSPLYAPATVLGRAGVVFGRDMTSEAALTKLAYLLALPGLSPEQVAEKMSISLRGELTETSGTQFEHPYVVDTLVVSATLVD